MEIYALKAKYPGLLPDIRRALSGLLLRYSLSHLPIDLHDRDSLAISPRSAPAVDPEVDHIVLHGERSMHACVVNSLRCPMAFRLLDA
jgi:hypothetical protein